MRRVVVLLLLFCFFTGAQAEVEDWEQFYLQLEKAYGGSISAEEFLSLIHILDFTPYVLSPNCIKS